VIDDHAAQKNSRLTLEERSLRSVKRRGERFGYSSEHMLQARKHLSDQRNIVKQYLAGNQAKNDSEGRIMFFGEAATRNA
jgi:hypothetical protein